MRESGDQGVRPTWSGLRRGLRFWASEVISGYTFLVGFLLGHFMGLGPRIPVLVARGPWITVSILVTCGSTSDLCGWYLPNWEVLSTLAPLTTF